MAPSPTRRSPTRRSPTRRSMEGHPISPMERPSHDRGRGFDNTRHDTNHGNRGREWTPVMGVRRSSTTPIRAQGFETTENATRTNRSNTVRSRYLSPRGRVVDGSPMPHRASISSARPQSVQGSLLRRRTNQSYASTQNPSVPGGFSVAGPDPILVKQHHHPYVDPGYAELNPAYAQPVNTRPVWGLAKPMPRVVRPGMVPTASEVNASAQAQAQAQAEAPASTPQQEADLESGRIHPSLQLDRVSSEIRAAQELREQRLVQRFGGGGLQRIGSRMSAMTPIREQSPAGSTRLEETAEGEEQDVGTVPIPRLRPTAEGGIPFPAFDLDNVSQASTDVEDEGWTTEGEQLQLQMPYGPEDEMHNLHTHWSVVRTRFREPLAELLAVTVQLTLGFCADLTSTTSNGTDGNFVTVGLSWGFATMLGVYVAGGISGAHLNPAISIMLWVYRGFPLRKVPSYLLAQILGAFIAALVAFSIYKVDILKYGGAELATSGTVDSFITSLRNDWVGPTTGFFTEFTGTTILAVAVLALGDDQNAPPGAGMNALVIGLVVTVLTWSFNYNTGFAGNPTRDLGPRFAVWALGYGGGVFSNGWWVYGPWAATISGALFGGALYDIAIFVGGESPINYPRRRMKRAGHKWKGRWKGKIRRTKKRIEKKLEDSDST